MQRLPFLYGYVCRYFLGISMKYVEIPLKYPGSTLDLETPKYCVFPWNTWKYLGTTHSNNMRYKSQYIFNFLVTSIFVPYLTWFHVISYDRQCKCYKARIFSHKVSISTNRFITNGIWIMKDSARTMWLTNCLKMIFFRKLTSLFSPMWV